MRAFNKSLLVALTILPWCICAQTQVFSNHEELLREARGQSLIVLRNAMERASRMEEPGMGYANIAENAIINREPEAALALIAEMSTMLRDYESDRPGYSSETVEAFTTFAKCVAPFSIDHRDVHLKRALWCLDRHTKDGMKLLTIMDEFNLYRALLSPDFDSSSLDPSRLLLRLDPRLYIKIVAGDDDDKTRRVLMSEVRDLHKFVCHGNNTSSQIILEYLIEHGERGHDILDYYKYYDALQAAKMSQSASLIAYLAWSRPNDALTLATEIADNDVREQALRGISRVWAYTKPDKLERVTTLLNSAYHRELAHKIALEEQGRRSSGLPPTLSEGAFSDGASRTIMRDGIELSAATKDENLRKLILVFEKGEPGLRVWIVTRMLEYDYDTAYRFVQRLSVGSSMDEAVASVVSRAAYWGDHQILKELLEGIRDEELYVSTACVLAKHMITRRYYTFNYREVGKHVDQYVSKIDQSTPEEGSEVEK